MLNLQINLLEEQRVSPLVVLWRRRLYLTLAITSAVLLIGGIGVFFVHYILLSRSEELQNKYTQITETIEEKKDIEGLYMTLASRLQLIDTLKSQNGQVGILPEAVEKLLGESMEMESFSVENKKVEMSLQTNNQETIGLILDELASFSNDEFSFSNIVVNETEVDEDGNYLIKLELSLNKQK